MTDISKSSRPHHPGQDPLALYVQAIADAQPRVYAFIMTLVGDLDIAKDLLQQTNLILWEKREDYDPARSFDAWACGIARFEVLAHHRDFARSHLVFSEAALTQLAVEAVEDTKTHDARRAALPYCMSKLTDHQRQLITQRYSPNGSVAVMAEQLDRPVGSVSVALTRIRKALAQCIRTQIEKEADR